MKLHDLFKADPFYREVEDLDSTFNPESSNYKSEERKKSKAKNKSSDGTPVVTDDVDNGEEKWTNKPKSGETQSSGYRGGEEAKDRCDIPHEPYQDYDPSYYVRDMSSNNL